MKTKLFTLFVALAAATALWASNVITYTATEKLRGRIVVIDLSHNTDFNVAIISHEFFNGVGTITFAGEVTTIGTGIFDNVCLTSITIPNSVTTIGDRAFDGCWGLTSIEIPNSVTTIGKWAFSGCSGLTSIEIPNSVTTIGDGAFLGCSGLTSINVSAANTHYASIDGVLFNYAKDTLIQYPIGNLHTKYTIPNSVTTIGEKAFYFCNRLTSITVPNSVITIGEYAFNQVNSISYSGTAIGSPWYAKCRNGYVDEYLVYSDTTKTVLCGCSSTARGTITIPNSVTTIGECAFNGCTNLTSITIPNSVTTIGDYAFNGCTNLTSITIPNSVTTIGDYAFSFCHSLSITTILNTNVKIGEYAFDGCTITNLYCGIDVDLSNASGKVKNIHRLNEEELQYVLPFNQYVIGFVEPRINEWQKKGEFEKTTDWQKRVTDATRKQKIDSLVLLAKKNYLAHYQINNNPTFILGTYDADNEVYPVQSSSGEDLLVAIPISEAPYVKQNWSSCIVTPHYGFAETDVVLLSVDFAFPNKKTYTYKSTYSPKTE